MFHVKHVFFLSKYYRANRNFVINNKLFTTKGTRDKMMRKYFALRGEDIAGDHCECSNDNNRNDAWQLNEGKIQREYKAHCHAWIELDSYADRPLYGYKYREHADRNP